MLFFSLSKLFVIPFKNLDTESKIGWQVIKKKNILMKMYFNKTEIPSLAYALLFYYFMYSCQVLFRLYYFKLSKIQTNSHANKSVPTYILVYIACYLIIYINSRWLTSVFKLYIHCFEIYLCFFVLVIAPLHNFISKRVKIMTFPTMHKIYKTLRVCSNLLMVKI